MTTQRREVRKLIQQYCDEYSVLFACQKDPPFYDALADALIERFKPKRKQRTPAQEKSAELYWLARALAEVCVWNYDANGGRLLREAKQLAKATPTPTPALVKQHYGANSVWYKQGRWGRGETQPPTPGQIRSTWARLVGGAQPGGDGPRRFTV